MSDAIELTTGKFKPKCNKATFVINLIWDLCLMSITSLFIYGILDFPSIDLKILVVVGILIPLMDYIILLSPYQQYTENYYIELKNEGSIDGFKLFYRKKELLIKYKINDDGKVSFEDKLNNFSYADGSKISFLTKHRIVNYFMAWLNDNNLLDSNYANWGILVYKA